MQFTLKHVTKQRYGLALHENLDPLPLPATSPDKLSQIFCYESQVISNVGPADVYHPSYAYYLMQCWANHYGAVITAEMLWFSALTTFARLVSRESEAFRQYFVDFQGRREIAFHGQSDESAVYQFIQQALPLIKLDLMPEFSTSTELSKLALGVAFCDSISPYVYGMILSCGIPHVTVADKLEDWQTLEHFAARLGKMLVSTKAGPFFDQIANRSRLVQHAITSGDGQVFQNMFDLANCSSGSPVYEFSGWMTEFFQITNRPSAMLKTAGENCAKAIFKREGMTDLGFYCGIFGSKYDASTNVLTPHFDRMIAEAL